MVVAALGDAGWTVTVRGSALTGRASVERTSFVDGADGRLHPPRRLLCSVVISTFVASLDSGEAVLRFPYDERLRVLLRAIPGRRWDPGEKVWRIPLDPERAEALAKLLASLPARPQVSDALARALARRRARRRDGECVIDVVRPDENWWLSFPADADAELVQALMEHPDAYGLPAIGRALIPLDERSRLIVRKLHTGAGRRPRLTEHAEHALTEIAQRARAAEQAPGARRVVPHAEGRSERAAERATPWHGTVEVACERGEPVFLLLGDLQRLPQALRERAVSAPGGATVALTLDSWGLMDGQLHGWISSGRGPLCRGAARGPAGAAGGAGDLQRARGPDVRARPRP